MKFLDALRPSVSRSTTYSMDAWAAELYQRMLFEGNQYPLGFTTTYGKDPAEPIGESFAGYVQGGLKSNGIVFALELKRLQVFSQARFQYQRMRDGRPGDLFGDRALALLERPWPGGTTGDLLARMLMDADFAGNAFNTVIDGEVVRLRPDWVEIVLEPRTLDQGTTVQVGWRHVGILYYEGGVRSGVVPAVFLPGQYSHFAPVPDPEATYRGMSWLTPVIRELQADTSATKHKLKFFENAATPNLAVSLAKEITPEQFKAFVAEMDKQHQGADNAYKTLYTAGGADVTVIGQNMQQLDFKVTQGAGETRLAAAAGVHPVIAGLSEGMQGSSLNAGNYAAAKRAFVDTTCRHLWQNAAGSLESLAPAPEDSRLWYDARDIPFLLDDMKDRAEIQAAQAQTIRTLGDAGYTSDSIKAAVLAEDWSLLEHSGLFSVQLQPPGTTAQPETPATPEAGRADTLRHLPGKHAQSSHGRKRGRGSAPAVNDATEPAQTPAPEAAPEAPDAPPTPPKRPSGRGLTRDQYEAMQPDRMWTAEKRQQILDELRTTENGKVLADTLDRFQDGGSIARLRTKIEKRLAGEEVDATSAARADAVIGALRDAPPDLAPDKLYRGMTVGGSVDSVLAKYRDADTIDLNLTSFSTDRAAAKRFQDMTSSRGKTRVMVELVGGGKRLLPIQNLARDRRLFREKEWVGGGRYRVVEAKKSGDGGVLLRIEQVGTL